MMKCSVEFIGALHFLGIFLCVCMTLTWCKVDGLLVSTAFLLPSCQQEDLKRSRVLQWDFPSSSFKRAAVLWPHPKTCPKVIFLFQHQFICLSFSTPLSSSLCVCCVLRPSLFCFSESSLQPCLKVQRAKSGGENVIPEFQVVPY